MNNKKIKQTLLGYFGIYIIGAGVTVGMNPFNLSNT